jgi:beta-1,2-mannobiose phosphorylase / 1,2-beta-oligomannan phosphorylase
MIAINKEGILLKKTSLTFEEEGVLNPAVIREGDILHVFYRAVSKGNYSTIGYCKLQGPVTEAERHDTALITPHFDFESHGVEDPRIVKIDDVYYLTYTAYDGLNAMGALATSRDLLHFERHGLIVPSFSYDEIKPLIESHGPLNEKYARYNSHKDSLTRLDQKKLVWDKNVVFFPRRINGKLHFLHRIKPDIQLVSVNELSELTADFWKDYYLHLDKNIVLTAKYKHEVSYIGGGCPPIETANGWLVIYHSVYDSINGYIYSACAALLDLENPYLEIARLPYALFKPDQQWELRGEVNNVVFPTGTALFDDTLYIYYGAADEQIACASVSLKELINELLKNTKT